MKNIYTTVGNCHPKSIISIHDTKFYVNYHTTNGLTEVESINKWDDDPTFTCFLVQTAPVKLLYGELYENKSKTVEHNK